MDAGFRREAHQQSMAQNVVRGIVPRLGRRSRRTADEGADDGAAAQPAAPDPMPLIAELLTTLQRMNAPKRIVRDESGQAGRHRAGEQLSRVGYAVPALRASSDPLTAPKSRSAPSP